MAWNYDKSKERIQRHIDNMGPIEIKKLSREADLNGLLSETCCRDIYGAHVYFHLSNFADLASEDAPDETEFKRLIQAVHIYQREVARIVEDDDKFDGLRVHFQGGKLHALFYRPIDDSNEIAKKAFFLLVVLKDFVANVFNPSFEFYDDFEGAGGGDIGNVVGTRNGSRSDRELLFLGAAANYAAKVINAAGQLRFTDRLYEALPDDLREWCIKISDDVYQIKSLDIETLDSLLEEHGISWDRQASGDRVNEDKRRFPLKDIQYSSANTLIDLDALGINNNKRVSAASIFGDVTGFTAYIDEAEDEDGQMAALRVLHAIRKEMATVVKADFDGLRVQFQGDRVQGFYHLPKDDESKIAEEAVEAAIGLQSSMEKTIKEVLPESSHLELAVGVDLDITLISKLGTHAHRDRIALGGGVERAASNEEKCSGGQIGVSAKVYNLLPERLQKHFAYSRSAGCYIAENLTADVVERAEKASYAVAGAPAYIRSDRLGTQVLLKEDHDARVVIPARSYGQAE